MVHGTSLLVRYVMMLKRPIDKYDHLMDVMKRCRHDLDLIENDKKVVVFGGYSLDERFNMLPGSKNCFDAYNEMHSSIRENKTNLADFESPRGSFEDCRWSSELRRTLGDIHGWFDTYFYSAHKFNMSKILAKFNEDEWLRIDAETKKQMENDPYCDATYTRTYIDLLNTARLASIHKNPDYLAQIREREAIATTVPLTEKEQSVLECVRSAPELKDNIDAEGFEMYTESSESYRKVIYP